MPATASSRLVLLQFLTCLHTADLVTLVDWLQGGYLSCRLEATAAPHQKGAFPQENIKKKASEISASPNCVGTADTWLSVSEHGRRAIAFLQCARVLGMHMNRHEPL